MISKYRYEQNKRKYQNLVGYTINHPNLLQNIKDEVLYIMEKYRIAIGCMEVEEVKELIEKCIIEDSSKPLKKELHCILTGKSYSLDDSDSESKTSKEDREDDCYNLD